MNNCWASMSFMDISSVTAIFCLRASVNFHPYFPYILNDLGDIQYRKSLHNSVEQFWVLWKLKQFKPYFTQGCKWNFAHIFHIFHLIGIKQYRKCPQKCYDCLWVLWKLTQWERYVTYRCKWIAVHKLFDLGEIWDKRPVDNAQYCSSFITAKMDTKKTVFFSGP